MGTFSLCRNGNLKITGIFLIIKQWIRTNDSLLYNDTAILSLLEELYFPVDVLHKASLSLAHIKFPPLSCHWSFIKSPRYTGGDLMFLYRFVRRHRRRRRHRPQILVHAITFEQLCGFLSFLARLLALTCRLPDYILVDFRRDLDLDFSR